MSSQLLRGFTVGFALIAAIGAQNAFIIARAIRGDRHILVASICAACDLVLLALAVTGVGAAFASHPSLATFATWAGIAFLAAFGARALRSAFTAQRLEIQTVRRTSTLRATVIATLAVTLLNPHTFLDTFVLVGGITAPLPAADRYAFGIGAALASLTWFATLAFAGRRLAPWFRRPITWRILDLLVATMMWTLALALLADVV